MCLTDYTNQLQREVQQAYQNLAPTEQIQVKGASEASTFPSGAPTVAYLAALCELWQYEHKHSRKKRKKRLEARILALEGELARRRCQENSPLGPARTESAPRGAVECVCVLVHGRCCVLHNWMYLSLLLLSDPTVCSLFFYFIGRTACIATWQCLCSWSIIVIVVHYGVGWCVCAVCGVSVHMTCECMVHVRVHLFLLRDVCCKSVCVR